MRSTREWLEGLKAGDKVAVRGSHSVGIQTVKRTTKTMIMVGEREMRFSKAGGRTVGGDIWSRVYLGEVTDEVRKEIDEARIIYKYRHINDKLLSVELMAKVIDLVEGERA